MANNVSIVPAPGTAPVRNAKAPITASKMLVESSAEGQSKLYLSFMLCGETFAIDILRIREIIEYAKPTEVPMMPPSVCGVINLRGSVVPVIDLAIRFGREPAAVARRTCFVIVEIEHNESLLVLGLVVDRVNAVMEIADTDVEPPPPFGARISPGFISGMARRDKRFIIILNIARTLSIEEIASIIPVGEHNA